MNKIAAKDVTDALAQAMENADRMKNVLIIWETSDDEKETYGFITNEELTVRDSNFMVDTFKSWLFDCLKRTD